MTAVPPPSNVSTLLPLGKYPTSRLTNSSIHNYCLLLAQNLWTNVLDLGFTL